MLAHAQFDENPPQRVLDIGGADVNGTIHPAVRSMSSPTMTLDVLDIAPGPGVTHVGDATSLATWLMVVTPGTYDLVICTEVLEHVKSSPLLITGAWSALRRGGWMIGTCAAPGRRPHGARGTRNPPPGEWYRNIAAVDLLSVLHWLFPVVITESYSGTTDRPADLYWAAQA